MPSRVGSRCSIGRLQSGFPVKKRGAIGFSLTQNQKWIGREVEVLVDGPAAEKGFVQGHTRGNHVALVKDALPRGIHRVFVAAATPNRLYCTLEPGVFDGGLPRRPAVQLHNLSVAVRP